MKKPLGGMPAYDKASVPLVPRTRGGVRKSFDRMDLIDPGLVNVSEWRSSQRHSSQAMRGLIYGGAARKP